MKRKSVYPVIGVLALGIMANGAVQAKEHEKSGQTQGEKVKGKIVLLDRYISSEVGNIQGQIDHLQRQQGQRQEQQQRQQEGSDESAESGQRSGQSESDRSDAESRARQDALRGSESDQGRQSQESRGQQETSADREQFGDRQQHSGQEGLSARAGQEHGDETLVLVSKEGGLFGSSDKAYVLWFGPKTAGSGMEMTRRQALSIAQGGSSQFGVQSDQESQQGQRSATERARQQQEDSERSYVRGEGSGSQAEVSVTGKKVSKGGLNVLWVQSIDQGHGEHESGKHDQKGSGQKDDQKSQRDRN